MELSQEHMKDGQENMEDQPTKEQIAQDFGLDPNASWEEIARAYYQKENKDFDKTRKEAA